MKARWASGWLAVAMLVLGCGPQLGSMTPPESSTAKSSSCPAPGSTVMFQKALDHAFISDFNGCDVTVEAEYHVKSLTQGGDYIDFMVMPVGSHDPSGAPRMGTQAKVSVPKTQVDPLLTAKIGDRFSFRGVVEDQSGQSVLVASSVHKP